MSQIQSFIALIVVIQMDLLQDYKNETDWREKVPQENCGKLAVEQPKKKSICKVDHKELMGVRVDL